MIPQRNNNYPLRRWWLTLKYDLPESSRNKLSKVRQQAIRRYQRHEYFQDKQLSELGDITLIPNERKCQQQTVWSREAQKNLHSKFNNAYFQRQKKGEDSVQQQHWQTETPGKPSFYGAGRLVPHIWHMTFKGATNSKMEFQKDTCDLNISVSHDPTIGKLRASVATLH